MFKRHKNSFYIKTHKTRFWRKNMAENYELLAPCVGRDINRNFNFQWMVAGSSEKVRKLKLK